VFVGGRNWSVAIGAGGGGGVAWFPLAPEEPYYPAYHVSNTYVRNVNVTNVNVTNINVTNVNVTNINYRNRRAPDAVTVVSHDAFVQSRPVNRSVIVVARDRLDQARVVGFAARVTPTQQSVLAQPTVIQARRPRPDARTPGRTAGSGPAREPAGSRQAAGGATVCIDALKTRRPADPLPRLSAGAPEGRAAATAAGAAASGRAAGQGTEGRAGHDEVEKAVVD